jgi:purine-binding chemotaxis protein CheW
MTEKLGRKALFMGVAEKQEAESPPGEEERRVLREFSTALEAALSGNYSEKISETDIPDSWRSFAASFNQLLQKAADDHRDCAGLLLAFEQSPVPMTLRYGSGMELLSNISYRSIMEERARNDPVGFSAVQMKETELIEEGARQGSPVSQRICLPGIPGTGLEYLVTAVPLGDGSEAPYFLLYLEDISKTVDFEKSLAALQQEVDALVSRQNQILLENPLPVLITDLLGNIFTANEAFRRVSGISMPDTGTVAYSELPLTESIGQNIQDIARFRKMGAAQVTFEFPSGRHTLWQYGIPVSGPDAKEQIVLIFFDITAQKAREQDMESHIAELKKEVETLTTRPSPPAPEPEALPATASPSPETIHANAPVAQKSPVSEQKKGAAAPVRVHDVVEFQLGGEKYALDINFAREIVEMMPITPIPRSPPYLRGVMNLRGEITNIITINSILGLSESSGERGRKIIVLSSEATGGENIGIVVDEVHSVIQIQESDVEHLGGGLSGQASGHIKGIIKTAEKGVTERKGEQDKDLIIWIDMQKLLQDLIPRK